ncbi:hypothetical protein B5C34_04615 [Pacificimonas flava]|uniref:TPR repeat protein n=2 Tax=Pacificimonas TaxID=1960290 RepID=A0A219B393_9SPHN|nr:MULTISPECIES: tetratricopeptide repeat protein [Pacificimonas]MBZ6377499.1 tetratricopeptide repeat protein [Pacificimonas aurantium]OWV32805.1 hypothetical protein B5C34_04615 [Pacificimonas flava]
MSAIKLVPALLGAAACFSLPATTPATANLSPQAMRLLDPSAMFLQSCGQTARSMLPERVQFAQAGDMEAWYKTRPPLYDDLGGIGFEITTASEEAQRYFNQGFALLYGFNHQEAIRAFREAQRLDPDCAMCFWGEAFAHGPNINAPMDPRVLGATRAALARAEELKIGASERERMLIDAVAIRYRNGAQTDLQADAQSDEDAFADAMLQVAAAYPLDDHIAAIAAEAQMNTQPWDYWGAGGFTPKGRIGHALRLVEGIIARDPNHAQASHLYIHLMESSANPAQAEAAADRLAAPLVPNSGHLVHMPAHLYYRIGRFADSIRANVEAARVDEEYLATSPIQGLYRFGYYPHNVHFIVTSAQMAGDMETALSQAEKLREILSVEVTSQFPWTQPVDAAPYFAYAQFGTPEDILALEAPDSRLPYVVAAHHYARAVAYALLRDEASFAAELTAMRALGAETDWSAMIDGGVPVPVLLALADKVAQARLHLANNAPERAIPLLEEARALEADVNYMEPPYWYYPVSQTLGAAHYMTGDAAKARDAFRAALVTQPGNGWALWGLARAEEALSRPASAAAAEAAFAKAWLGEPGWLSMARL